MNRVVRVFPEVYMYYGHDGLVAIAKEAGIDLQQLKPGELVVFINTTRDKIKLYGANNVIGYYRNKPGHPIDLRTIPLICKSFGSSGRIDYEANLKEAIIKALERKAS